MIVKFLQINLAGKSAAQELSLQKAREDMVDIIIASEYYKYGLNTTEANGWYCDKSSRAAIVNCGDTQIIEIGKAEDGFTWITIENLRIYTCYWSSNTTLTDYENWLGRLETSIRTATCDVVIAGNFNAKHREWGSRKNDAKGEALSDFMHALGLIVCNQVDKPTWQRWDSESHIDVTMASANVATRVINWRVLDEESHSDDNYIEFKIEITQTPRPERELRRRNTRNVEKKKLEEAIMKNTYEIDIGTTADDSAEAFNNAMTRILDEVAPKQTIVTRRRSVYWWTPQIKELRGKSNHLRRVYQRKLRRTNADGCLPEKEAMKKVKLELTKLIKRSKEDAWRELCRLVETDPWGRPYRLVMGKLCRKPPMPGTIIPGRMQIIVEGLFPTHQDKETTIWTTNEEPVFVTETELNQATSSLKANKSPGPDDVTNEILKKVIELRPRLILDIFNRCLLQASFPTIWKTARLVLIRKGGKPFDEPSSYRPLCMLNTIGKLFEKILDNRIRDFLETNDCLAPNQYGFRRGRSTIDAATRLREIVDGCRANVRNMVGLLTLDVRNAFNSAPWAGIIEAVTGKKLPTQTCKLLDDYFHDRSLLYEAAGKVVKKELTAGVPQGSVLGPTMWNILYDGLLHEQMPEGVELIAYADDVAITARANENYKVERMLEDAAEKVTRWLEDTGIELAIQKSETILFTRKRKHNQINVVIRGQTIKSKGTIKYLGLHLDSKLKFDEHARVAANKADEATNRLTRIMPNTGGAKSHRRKLLASVTQSIMLYGAPVWAKHMGRKGWNILDKSNRKMGLRVVAAYRTVSKEAVEVIAGMPPPELIAEYRRSIHVAEERQGAEEKMIQAWQAR